MNVKLLEHAVTECSTFLTNFGGISVIIKMFAPIFRSSTIDKVDRIDTVNIDSPFRKSSRHRSCYTSELFYSTLSNNKVAAVQILSN